MSLSPFKTINQERIKRRGQGKRRQGNRGTEGVSRGRDRVNGDRITEEQRYSNKDKVTKIK